jgi:hypothetical protein
LAWQGAPRNRETIRSLPYGKLANSFCRAVKVATQDVFVFFLDASGSQANGISSDFLLLTGMRLCKNHRE